MRGALKRKLASAPENSSRHYLREWAREASAAGTDKSHRVLDVGAGDAPYRDLFQHVTYETADLATYEKAYAELDHVCDITNMPMADDTYDQVFCSQTLEHVKDPVQALREIRRVLKPGGTAWLSAPLFYEEHEVPFDYFRYTQYGWRHMAAEAGMEVLSVDWLEGYFGTVAHQLHMAATSLPIGAPTRVLLFALARRFARRDMKERYTDGGMCKNYRITLVKPLNV